MSTRGILTTHCDALVEAAAQRDEQRFHAALDRLIRSVTEAEPAEVQAAAVTLTPLVASLPFGVGVNLVQVLGSMTNYGADPMPLLPVLARRAAEAMEQAARFAAAYREASGEDKLPDPEDPSLIPPILDRLTGPGAPAGRSEQEAYRLAEAWFAGGNWVQPVLYLCQRKDVRMALPERDRLTAATRAVREHIDTAHWLYGLLLVLDDAPLTVLHRPTGRGYQVTISGIGDNFQLHTLLAAHLIGDGSRGLLPGTPPSAAEIAAASDGTELVVPDGIRGNFNLVDAYGGWIWNEGRPADIPVLEGARVVVLDPPPYERRWNAGRAYPLMRPSVTVDRILPADLSAHWLGLVKPSVR